MDGRVQQPWLQVTPASGGGTAKVSISVVSVAGFPNDGNVDCIDRVHVYGGMEQSRSDEVTHGLKPNGTAQSIRTAGYPGQ